MNVTFDKQQGEPEWLTPPHIIEGLCEFDLDPCAPIIRPWPTAKKHYTIEDNGLLQSWEGRVWCNPPYGNQTQIWLDRCALYGNAIALTFARTETNMFFNSVWDRAHAILFIKGRLSFHRVDGSKGVGAGAPSVLIAYGQECAEILKSSKIKGKYIQLK